MKPTAPASIGFCLSAILLGFVPAALAESGGKAGSFPRSIDPGRPATADIETQVVRPGPVKLTLADAVYLSLRYNRQLESADIARISQRFDLRVAQDKFTPQLSLGANAQMGKSLRRERLTYTTNFGPQATWTSPIGTQVQFAFAQPTSRQKGSTPSAASTFDVSFAQPLLRGFGTDVNEASVVVARLNEKANILGLRQTVIDGITNVVQTFRGVLQANAQIAIAEDSLTRSRQLLEVNRQLVAAGRMAAIDTIQTEAQLAQQELGVIQAQNVLEAAKLRLLALLDIDDHSRIDVVDEPEPGLYAINVERATEIAHNLRTDLIRAEFGKDIARINLTLAEDGRNWELNAIGSGRISGSGRSRNDSFRTLGDEVRGYTAGLQLRIPLNDLSLEQRVVSSKVGLRQADLSLADVRQSIDLSVRDAVRSVDVAWRTLELARRAQDLSEQKLRAEREKLAVGRSSNFQVLTYETDLLNARTQLLGARINYANALTVLDQTLGTTLDTWQVRIRD